MSEMDYSVYCRFLPDFECEQGRVFNGRLTIFKGYTWDGCTPKFHLGPLSFGTWDGKLNKHNGRQECYFASMVHDFLYQYELGTRQEADREFLHLLGSFKLRRLYYLAVRIFGRRW